jgi:hypothetical protein
MQFSSFSSCDHRSVMGTQHHTAEKKSVKKKMAWLMPFGKSYLKLKYKLTLEKRQEEMSLNL